MQAVFNPWPWYVSGPLIGLSVPLLLLLSGKALGISSSFQNLCGILFARDRKALAKDPAHKREAWKVVFAVGVVLGGFLAARLLSSEPMAFLPVEYHSFSGAIKLLTGGMLVGFGSRYAEGCTSGHAITGLASLQFASLMAVIGFFTGGLTAASVTLLIGALI
jgi:uncharacterized protein